MAGEANDRRVFTDEWVARLRDRYERLQVLHRVATSAELQATRDEIEEWVAQLAPMVQHAMARKLQQPDHWLTTRNELAVAAQLRRLGYHLEYEKKLQVQGRREPLTPDWYIHQKGDIPAFLVEVSTRNAPLHAQEDDLKRRLEQIPVDACLIVDPRQAQGGLSQHRNKRIANRVRLWLTRDNPAVGEWACFEGVRCKVEDRGLGCSTVLCEILGHLWVDVRPLRKKFEDKIDKYKRLATQLQLPLVIAVVPTEAGPYDFTTFDWGFFGTLGVQVFRDATGKAVAQRVTRARDGLLSDVHPAFSAGIMVLRNPRGEWETKAIHNPDAANPLPGHVFGQGR